ncbi:MAG: N-6 DNA methylase [Rhodopirellula sp.]|nr:N-6 DNA methylase [Rhodopirellula sp.]
MKRTRKSEPRRSLVLNWWLRLANGIADCRPAMSLDELETAARDTLHQVLFEALCQQRGLRPWGNQGEDLPVAGEAIAEVRSDILARYSDSATGVPAELLGESHQQLLAVRLKQGPRGLHATSSTTDRKFAGVFYTPRFIADYMIENTLGRRLEACPTDPSAASGLRLIDPACGCGAFLLAVCRCFLAWAVKRGVSSPALATARLMHGMDLDGKAIAIARRCLWLELGPAMGSRDEADNISAVLRTNVRCGNALLDEQGQRSSEFDFVVANPPYRRELNSKVLFDSLTGSSLSRFRSPRMDYWYYFAFRGLELLREGGRLALIVNSYWTGGKSAERLIASLRQNACMDEILLLNDAPVFEGVAGRHMILFLTKGPNSRPVTVKRPLAGHTADAEALLGNPAAVEVFRKDAEQLFRAGRLDLEPANDAVLAKLAAGTPLGQLGRVRQGIAENPASITRSANVRHGSRWTIGEGVFALKPDELAGLDLPESERLLVRPYYDLCDLGRYRIAETASLRLIYATDETWPELQRYPGLAAHLSRFRPLMEARRETRRGCRRWWHLHWPRDRHLWESRKIIAVQMARRPTFVPAAGSVYVPFSVNVFLPDEGTAEDLNYLTALLNSRLLWCWYRHHAKRRGVGLEVNGSVLARTPIRRIDFSNPRDKWRHDEIVDLVSRMLALTRWLSRAEPPAGTGPEKQEIDRIDQRIDTIVEDLYGLTVAEVALLGPCQ